MLSSLLSFTGCVQYVMKQFTEMEIWMTSTKRILEYGKLEPEEDQNVIKSIPPKTWPENGKIEFRSVSLNYDQDLNSSLDGVSFNAESGQKVCVLPIHLGLVNNV